MSNTQIMRLKTIQNEYLQHTDKTIAEAKVVAQLMHRMDKNKNLQVIYRKYLDLFTVIKYLEAQHNFNDKHGLIHLSEMLPVFLNVCAKQPYGKKLAQEVNAELAKCLNIVEKVAELTHIEGKQNEKSITFPNGLSSSLQQKLYEAYVKTDKLAKDCVTYLVTRTYTLEVGQLGKHPALMSLSRWESFNSAVLATTNNENSKVLPVESTSSKGTKLKSLFANLGNYNSGHISAGYSELANEPEFKGASIFERGFDKIFNRRKK